MAPDQYETGSEERYLPKSVPEETRSLVLLWSAGIGTAYAVLIVFLCWMGYRAVLMYAAYRNGDFDFIRMELTGYAAFTGIYFGAALLLRIFKVI